MRRVCDARSGKSSHGRARDGIGESGEGRDQRKRLGAGRVYQEYDGVRVEVRSVTRRDNIRARVTAAWICLVALAFLYAPLAAAALVAHGLDCCAGGYCPVREHHHHKQTPASEAPMDCGHDMSGITACSMSCCQDSVRPAVTPAIFLLPGFALVPAGREAIRPVVVAHSSRISRAVKPLSPPPRLSSWVL